MPDVAPGVITFGLGGSHTNMIVGFFHLGYFDGTIIIPPPVKPPGGGSGPAPSPGPAPRRDWQEDDYPPEQKIEVTIKIRMGKSPLWRERIFYVLPKNASIIVKVFNYINVSGKSISIIVSGVQNKLKSVAIAVSNFRNSKDEE